MSQWGVPSHSSHSRNSSRDLVQPSNYLPPQSLDHANTANSSRSSHATFTPRPSTPEQRSKDLPHDILSSPATPDRATPVRGSRPSSMVQTFQPPLMDVAQDTLPELLPIFTYLNSHSNKLYQEGYFLKLHDLDPRMCRSDAANLSTDVPGGRPSPDRSWQECFGQLVGTVLSVWDAAELDQAGEHGEVMPTFINLADASMKMVAVPTFAGRRPLLISPRFPHYQ